MGETNEKIIHVALEESIGYYHNKSVATLRDELNHNVDFQGAADQIPVFDAKLQVVLLFHGVNQLSGKVDVVLDKKDECIVCLGIETGINSRYVVHCPNTYVGGEIILVVHAIDFVTKLCDVFI